MNRLMVFLSSSSLGRFAGQRVGCSVCPHGPSTLSSAFLSGFRHHQTDASPRPAPTVDPMIPAALPKYFRAQYDDGVTLRKPLKVRGEIFRPFYHFPYIVHFRVVGRFKLYQAAILTVATPALGAFHFAGYDIVSQPWLLFLMGANLISLTTLGILTNFLQRWVGRMYLNEAGDKVLISHLTFFGTRHNVKFPTADIVPLYDSAVLGGWYLRVTRVSDSKDYYNLCLRFGGVFDKEALLRVFGPVDMMDDRLLSGDLKKPVSPPE